MEDQNYCLDLKKLKSIREQKLWKNEPKYFKRVKISPCAVMKMLLHANQGVEKGIQSKGQKPVEVMGLLLGHPSIDEKNLQTLVVTDVFPLPVEGAETKVLADDAEVINYMISLGESLELTRNERFMGWYHSHPFDVDVNSHCFLSSTDVGTQLQWQRAEDPHGNPWLAIVLDPLRSLAKSRPELQAYRVYPPEYTAPENETPDGTVVVEANPRLERWGSCWNRYYVLELDYFTSRLGKKVMHTLSEKFLWMRALGTSVNNDKEYKDRFSDRILSLANKVIAADSSKASYGNDTHGNQESDLKKATKTSCDIALEQCVAQTTQVAKNVLFTP